MSSNPLADITMDKMNRAYGRQELEKALVFEGDIDVTQVTAIMNEQIGHMRILGSMAATVDFGIIVEGRKIIFDNLRLLEEIITEVDHDRKLYFKLGNLNLVEYQMISMHRLRGMVLETGVAQ